MRSYKEFKSLAETAKQEYEILEGAAWTKKAGKNKEGGLNEKGGSLTREQILDLTLKHQARRLEIPVGHPFVLE